MEMADFINFLFFNTISNYYYIASVIILMISTGHIQSRVIIDFISSLLASTLYQLLEWPLKLSLFFYAVVPTIRHHGFKYKFAVLFLIVDLLVNTFLAAQIPSQGAMVACFDGPEECCGFFHYDIQKGPAGLWLEFLSRTLVTFYICCSIYVIVSKKNEIVQFVQIWYRFIAANIFRVLAVFNIFVFLIRFKFQEIGVFMLVVYIASRRIFQAWLPIPTANTRILCMERTLDVEFYDAVEPNSEEEQMQTSYEDCNDSHDENPNEDSEDAGDNSNEPDEADKDKNEGADYGSDDDLNENGEKDNNDDEDCDEDDEDCDEGDEDCEEDDDCDEDQDEDDDESQDDESDEDPDRVPEDINKDLDDGERCSLM